MAKKPQRKQAYQPKKSAPASARRKEKSDSLFSTGRDEFIFDRQNFMWMGIGLALVLLGLLAMSGGSMPDPNTWDPDIIYSFRRITLAPILMLAGFVLVIVGIFKKPAADAAVEEENTPSA
ncbi:MAG: DUF3098 domain-containing protein [Bacteroidetes bacterium]|nr:MAG: DUF3098 domain-containing protein [Bacteroidota bacterium]